MPSPLADTTPSEPVSLPPIKLSIVDLQTLHSGLVADADQLAELDQLVINSATALCGPHRVEMRLRMLAKALSIARVRCAMLESLLDARLQVRDEQGVRMVSKALEGARKHFSDLLAEHRHTTSPASQVKVSVGQADAVNVLAVGGGL